jgi:hypothetical protein
LAGRHTHFFEYIWQQQIVRSGRTDDVEIVLSAVDCRITKKSSTHHFAVMDSAPDSPLLRRVPIKRNEPVYLPIASQVRNKRSNQYDKS